MSDQRGTADTGRVLAGGFAREVVICGCAVGDKPAVGQANIHESTSGRRNVGLRWLQSAWR